LAVLTGAKRLNPDAGDALERVGTYDSGTALRVTIGARFVNILANDDRSAEIELRIAAVRRQMDATEDEKEWKHHHLRIGRLNGGMGVIWVGAATESERDSLLDATDRCLDALRGAQMSGVLPGGGRALLEAAQRVIERHGDFADKPGMRAAAQACQTPARWLAANTGHDPSTAVAKILQSPSGTGLDVTTGAMIGFRGAGILDSAETIKLALRIGLTTAILASDCGVLIHRPISLTNAEIRP